MKFCMVVDEVFLNKGEILRPSVIIFTKNTPWTIYILYISGPSNPMYIGEKKTIHPAIAWVSKGRVSRLFNRNMFPANENWPLAIAKSSATFGRGVEIATTG